MIVLNESEWAEKMVESRSLGKKPFETLSRVARYYLDKKYNKGKVRQMLNTFLLQCDPSASLPKWSDVIEGAISRASKRDALKIDYIQITKPEMDVIDNLSGKQIRRLAFTLLCLAKYWDIINTNKDHWVNSRDSEIMKMANINTSIKRQSAMFRTLNEIGLIQFSKKVDNTNVRVCFIMDGDAALNISDFRNLGYQYQKYHGGPFIECLNCGVIVKDPNKNKKGRPMKYCKNCAAEIKIQQSVNSAMRGRTHFQF